MIFYMDSRTLQDQFLVNEDDQDILDAQYVLVSNRIMTHGDRKNIIVANQHLSPSSYVMSQYNEVDMHHEYKKQLKRAKVFFASIVSASIEEGFHIILLTSEQEAKTGLMPDIADYVYKEFGYPVYEYGAYCTGYDKLKEYDRKKVLSKCAAMRKDAHKKAIDNILSDKFMSSSNKSKKLAALAQQDKKAIKKIAKKMDVYEPGLTKKELIEEIIEFST